MNKFKLCSNFKKPTWNFAVIKFKFFMFYSYFSGTIVWRDRKSLIILWSWSVDIDREVVQEFLITNWRGAKDRLPERNLWPHLQGFEPDFSFFLKASSSRIRLTIFWEGQICLKSWKNFFLKKPKKLPLTILQTWDCLTLEISSQEKAKWVWNVTITKIRLV